MCGGSVAQLLLCEFRVAQDPVVALLASILQVHVATADHLPLNEGEHVRWRVAMMVRGHAVLSDRLGSVR
jgi:hypothetical protein